MKKLINEARRLQQLAGLIKESQLSENQEIEINLEDVEEWDFSEPDEVMFVYDIQSSDSHPNMSWADNRIKFGLSIDNVKNLLYNQSKVQEKIPLEPYGIEDKNIDWVINLDKKTAEGIMDSYYGNYPDENPENLNEEARRLQQLAGLIKESQLSEDDIPAGGANSREFNKWLNDISETWSLVKEDLDELGVDINTISPTDFIETVINNGELYNPELEIYKYGKSTSVSPKLKSISFNRGLETFGSHYIKSGKYNITPSSYDFRSKIYPQNSKMD